MSTAKIDMRYIGISPQAAFDQGYRVAYEEGRRAGYNQGRLDGIRDTLKNMLEARIEAEIRFQREERELPLEVFPT